MMDVEAHSAILSDGNCNHYNDNLSPLFFFSFSPVFTSCELSNDVPESGDSDSFFHFNFFALISPLAPLTSRLACVALSLHVIIEDVFVSPPFIPHGKLFHALCLSDRYQCGDLISRYRIAEQYHWCWGKNNGCAQDIT